MHVFMVFMYSCMCSGLWSGTPITAEELFSARPGGHLQLQTAEALHPDGVLAGLEQASECNTQQCPPMGEEETPEHRAAVPSISALYGQSPR